MSIKNFSLRMSPREVLANAGRLSWFCLGLLVLASLLYYVNDMKFWFSQMEAGETEIVRLTEQRIGSRLEPPVADLLILSENPAILNYHGPSEQFGARGH